MLRGSSKSAPHAPQPLTKRNIRSSQDVAGERKNLDASRY